MSAAKDNALAAAVAEHGPFPMPVGKPMPVELTAEQCGALADVANRAINDEIHEELCACDAWPTGCVSHSGVSQGYWDTGRMTTAMPEVIGLWESLRNDRHAAKVAELRAERAQLQDDITGACLARHEEEQENDRLRARVAELEARPSPATVLRQVADKWAAHCPEHSDADDVWMDCPEDWVFELRRAADDLAEGGAL